MGMFATSTHGTRTLSSRQDEDQSDARLSAQAEEFLPLFVGRKPGFFDIVNFFER